MLQLPKSPYGIFTLQGVLDLLDQWYQVLYNIPAYSNVTAAQANTVKIVGNSINFGANIDITAEYGNVSAGGTAVVQLGGVQIAVFTSAATNPKIVFAITLNIAFGANTSFSVYTAVDNAGAAVADVVAFTMPDPKVDMNLTITAGSSSNLLAARIYNTVK